VSAALVLSAVTRVGADQPDWAVATEVRNKVDRAAMRIRAL
jgi:hypothetical protein